MSSSQLNVQASAVRLVRKIDEIVACRAPLRNDMLSAKLTDLGAESCLLSFSLITGSYVLHLLPVANAESQC